MHKSVSVWLKIGATVVALATLWLIGSAYTVKGRASVTESPANAATARSETTTGLLQTTDVITVRQYLPLVLDWYAPPYDTIFGVQLYYSIDEQSQALKTMRSGSVRWARWPVSWNAIEPTDTTPEFFNWYADGSIGNAYASNLKLIGTINGNPKWASDYSNGPIYTAAITDFVEFMAATVERYDGDGIADAPGSPIVRHWELYNEPDAGIEFNAATRGISYWGPFGDQYAAMLCAIYPAMKAASPDVQVVFGGIAYDNFIDDLGGGQFVREFLGDVLAAGGGACFDVMNFHYYPPYEANWSAYGPGLSGKATYLRQNYDLGGKPMMVTEAGWNSANYSIYPSTPTLQARYVIKLFTQARHSDLTALTWWTWIDPPDGYGPYGLLTTDLLPKLAYYAYQDAAVRIGRSTFEVMVDVGDAGVQAYRFMSPSSQHFYVLWSEDGDVTTVYLPLSSGQVLDMYGNLQTVVWDNGDGTVDGRIRVAVGADPIYVEAYP